MTKLLLITMLLMSLALTGQVSKLKHNAVIMEIGGSGRQYSLQVERMEQLSGRLHIAAGFAYKYYKDEHDFITPMSFLIGFKHQAELGILYSRRYKSNEQGKHSGSSAAAFLGYRLNSLLVDNLYTRVAIFYFNELGESKIKPAFALGYRF